MKLRQNWAVQELVEAFQQARPAILKLAKDVGGIQEQATKSAKKRKIDDTDQESDYMSEEPQTRRRKIRLQRRTRSASNANGDVSFEANKNQSPSM